MTKPKQRSRVNTRKIYEKHHNIKVPKGYEVHHILPRRLGGTDDIANLAMLSLDEHKAAHLTLFELYGDFRDLCAHHMIGGNFGAAMLVNASAGGKAAAKSFKARGQLQGFQAFDPEFQRLVAQAGGKVGGTKSRDMGLGIHAQTKAERLVFCSMGGKKGAATNGWLDPKVQSENGKRGGVKNAGFRWCFDGTKSIKYTASQQAVEPFDVYLKRTNYRAGRGSVPAQV